MSSLVVVVAEISVEVTLECGVTRHQSASEGRSPALLEDGALDALDGTVGLWSAGANEALLGARAGNRAGEGFGSELAAVVGADSLQFPTRGRELARDPANQDRAVLGVELNQISWLLDVEMQRFGWRR